MGDALHGAGSNIELVRNPQHADAVLEQLAHFALDRGIDPSSQIHDASLGGRVALNVALRRLQ